MSAVEKIIQKYNNLLKIEKDHSSLVNREKGRRGLKTSDVAGLKKTPGAVELQLQMELKACLDKWKKAQAEKTKKKNEENPSEDDIHTPSYGDLEAVLWRKPYYNKNCFLYMNKKKVRKDYFKMDGRGARLRKAYTHALYARHFETAYGFGQRPENFCPTAKIDASTPNKRGKKGEAGNAFPYTWNGHHMIPCSAFYLGQSKSSMEKDIFTQDQYMLLLMSDYDVNHGQNMIPLPDKKRFYQPVHDMVLHPSDHPRYTKMVQRGMMKASKELKELEGKLDEPHPNISVKIADKLAKFEDKLWKLLLKLGVEVVDARVAEEVLATQPLVRDDALK